MQNVAKLNALPYLVVLSSLTISYLKPTVAGEWQINPEVTVRETYSDNIMLVSKAQAGQQEYVSEIVPAIEVLGTGNRLKLIGNYSLQSVYYGRNFTGNRNISQFLLNSNAEVVEDWFYLDLGAQQTQRLLSTGTGVAADNLVPTSGRGDVFTTTIWPRIEHSFGRGLEFEASYSESQVRYDATSLGDGLIKNNTVRLSRGLGLQRLSWALTYDQDKQKKGDSLSSERKSSSGLFRYRVLDRVSVVANGGREEGTIVGGRPFRQGSYWSTGLSWTPTPRFSLELSSGRDDKQGAMKWVPTARTLFEVSYVDRNVGVRPSTAWSGSFSHRTRRTAWGLSYVDEISSDARLQVVEQTTSLFRDESGVFRSESINLYDVINEEFTRASSRANFAYLSKKNEISVVLTNEQRDYEIMARRGVTKGVTASWDHNFGRRTKSSVLYSFNGKRENLLNDIEIKVFSLGVSREMGRRTFVGMEYRRVVLNNNDVNKDYVENRLSANLKITL